MACFQSSREARLLILIDESGSLKQADPKNGRILAAEYAINDLSRRAAQKEATFHVAVRGFADDFEANDTWFTLPDDRQRAVEAVRSFAARKNGQGTDYWMALNGARAALAEADPAGAECQAMVWFSDGELDPTPTFVSDGTTLIKPYLGTRTEATREQAAEVAAQDLCRDGGVADQVRAAGVTTFGVALGSGGATRADFGTMEGITTGASEAGETCGSRTDPTPGEFFFTGGSDGLLSAFDSIFALDEIQTDYPPTDICQGDQACDGTLFVLDSSIRQVHIFATSDIAAPDVTLVPPSGEAVSVPWGKDNETTEIAVGGGALTVTGLTDNSIALDMSATGAEPWTGAWSIKFVDPAAASAGKQVHTRISISGGLVPTATIAGDGGEADTVRRGDQASITLGIQDREGAPVLADSLLGSVSMDVGLVTSDGHVTPVKNDVSKEEIGAPLSVDLSDAEVGSAQIRLKLRIVTAPTTVGDVPVPGTALAEAVNNIPFQLLLAADYPVIGTVIDFGRTEDQTTLPGSLPVTGPGCVWIDPASTELTAVPGDVGDPRLSSAHSSAESCLDVPAGSEGEVPVELALDNTGNGGIAGVVTAYVAPSGEPTRAETVSVRLSGSIERAPNVVAKWALFAATLAAGILIPLGLLYLTKWRGSVIPPRALFYEEIPVQVTEDQVLRNGAPFVKQSGDLRRMVPIPPQGARSLTVESAVFKVSAGRTPMGVGETIVTVPGAQVVSSEVTTSDKQGRGRLPLAVHNTWTAWSSPTGAQVLILSGADLGESGRQRLYADVADKLPRAFAHIDPAFKPDGLGAREVVASGVPASPSGGGEWDDWGNSLAATGGSATQSEGWGEADWASQPFSPAVGGPEPAVTAPPETSPEGITEVSARPVTAQRHSAEESSSPPPAEDDWRDWDGQ